MTSKKELESRLNLKQRQAAMLLVENEFNIEGTQKTQEEIAQEVGITRMGLYKWRTQNKTFIDYMAIISDEFLKSQQAFVYRQLMRTISGKNPSIRGIDLWMRRHGLLTDKKIIEDNTGTDGVKSNTEMEAEIAEIKALLNK